MIDVTIEIITQENEFYMKVCNLVSKIYSIKQVIF